MKKISIDQCVPPISFLSTDPKIKTFADLIGKNIVLYFYPKDNTPGCTLEGKDFRDHFTQFKKLNTMILGASRDTVASHDKFITKCEFPFPLISDTNGELCEYFDVIRNKITFGIKALGVERSTFLIDSKGVVRQIWRKVKVKGHVEEVLKAVKSLL